MKTTSARIVSLILATLVLGCGGSPVSPQGGRETLAVTAISPKTGSTLGNATVSIVGSGFQAGAVVTLDGAATDVIVGSSTLLTAKVAAHDAGTVDVVVTNPGGASSRLAGGYTYVLIPPPAITAISPNAGSTDGGTPLTITGTGFQSGAIVRVGDAQGSNYVENATTIHVTAPQHTPGDVDITVHNPDGQSAAMIRGYSFALPGSFDFNGEWEGWADGHGFAGHGEEFTVKFTVRNNTLTSISCGTGEPVSITTPARIEDGRFSFSPSETISMNGRILSAFQAVGAINIPPCGPSWYATKR